ncbi:MULTISPECIES: epoxide hydrolase family protein [unclassified Mesorhizobium]|uniref:epoxide hydrolase family protein n=1 Tax=unclassified Mesorhizobium TaxID=325217 RepID=UPI00333B6756
MIQQIGSTAMDAHPFKIQIPNEQLEDLQRRLSATRWPIPLSEAGWSDGADLPFIKRLADYWRDRFDWRVQEARLNRLPQYLTRLNNLDVHFVHQPGNGPAPLPLIITHGWPGSFIEMEHVIPLLADPAAHGGDPADAFHVVVPSLPGYGFSQAPTEPGFHSGRIAELWVQLMRGLGYDRFASQGGDIGAGVSAWMARLHSESVLGVHVNYIPGSYRPPLGAGLPPVTVEEQAFLDKAAAWTATEGAYAHLQGTKPQTLAYALTDSPIGLAAWMIEKFRSWSDCDGDVERTFGMDTLLTDVSLYWFSNALTSSLRLYKENRLFPLAFETLERVSPPFGVALFPRELPMPPRSWVARVFDVQRWTSMPRGGHFAALEEPSLLVEDIRAFFRPMRSRPETRRRM